LEAPILVQTFQNEDCVRYHFKVQMYHNSGILLLWYNHPMKVIEMELNLKYLNGSSERSIGAGLKYHGVQDKGCLEEGHHSGTLMASILFDESHGQLLKSRLAKSKRGVDTLPQGEHEAKVGISAARKNVDAPVAEKVDAEREFGNCQKLIGGLKSLVKDWKLKLEGFSSDERGLNNEVLDSEKVKILVLAAREHLTFATSINA
jgi:hypothetical protein